MDPWDELAAKVRALWAELQTESAGLLLFVLLVWLILVASAIEIALVP